MTVGPSPLSEDADGAAAAAAAAVGGSSGRGSPPLPPAAQPPEPPTASGTKDPNPDAASPGVKLLAVREEEGESAPGELGKPLGGSASFRLWRRLSTGRQAGGSGGGGGSGNRSRSKPSSFRDRVQWGWKQATHIWWGLPTACKGTIILAIANAILSLVYAVVGLLLPTVDEEIHISVTILITSIFVVFTVADAVIYENTLELATSILLDTLVLARVIWFAAQGTANHEFKITWVTLMTVAQAMYIVVGILAYRQFGWRLYSKLGVDFREKGAAGRMRLALQRNVYVTLLKINVMLLVVLTALGIDISIEKRGGDVQEAILTISLAGLGWGLLTSWVALRLMSQQHAAAVSAAPAGQFIKNRLLLLFHGMMLLAIGQPVAVLTIHNTTGDNVANADTSVMVSSIAYIVTSLGLWGYTVFMVKTTQRKALAGGSSVSAATSVVVAGDPLLAAMHAGAWLGKPTQRNSRKIRFFQLSHDGSTLRWGWKKFVRLYYVDDLTCNDADLTLTLAFPFDAELVLKFPDSVQYHAWRRGLAHLLLMLITPDAPHSAGTGGDTAAGAAAGIAAAARARAAAGAGGTDAEAAMGGAQDWRLVRSNSSSTRSGGGGLGLGLGGPGSPGPAPHSATSSGFRRLRELGVTVQELGRRVTPRRWNQGSPDRQRRRSERAAAAAGGNGGMDGYASGVEESGCSASTSHHHTPETPMLTAEKLKQQAEREARESLQQQKRQRMTAYLQTVALQVHPSLQPPVPPPSLRRAAAATPGAAAPAAAAAALLPPAPAGYARRASQRQLQLDEAGGSSSGGGGSSSSAPLRVSVGVQTEESELRQQAAAAAYSSTGSGSFHHWQQGAAAAAAVAAQQQQQGSGGGGGGGGGDSSPDRSGSGRQGSMLGGSDGDLAAQYALAMQSAMQGAGSGGIPAPPPQLWQLQQQEEAEQQGLGGGRANGIKNADADADVADQYMAAMQAGAAAAAAAAAAAVGQSPPPSPPQLPLSVQLQAPLLPPLAGSSTDPAVDSDMDGYAQYMAAMQQSAAAAAAGAAQQSAASSQAPSPQPLHGGGLTPSPPSARSGWQLNGRPRPPPLLLPLPGGEGAGSELQPSPRDLEQQQSTTPLGRRTTHTSASTTPVSTALNQTTPPSKRQRGSSKSLSPAQQDLLVALSNKLGTPMSPYPSQTALVSPNRSPGGGAWQLAVSVDVIDIEDLSFGKLLGAGAEGAVYAAWFLESPVAVKKFERVEDSLHEVAMYLQLGSHDNVVALRGLCQHDASMYLVLEYCPRGTLDVLLHHSAKRPWDPHKLLPLVRSIARGMHYLHSRNILHRDLKPANIFVGHGQMMKIGDFGMARIVATAEGKPHLRRLTPGTVGTLQYSAPELINEDLRPRGVEEMEWALKLDVWSFGVTLWEILERRRPFEGLTQHAVQAQWMADPYSARLQPVKLPEALNRAGKHIYRGLSDMVEDCTRLDPYSRPSFKDILHRLKSLAEFAERQGAGSLP